VLLTRGVALPVAGAVLLLLALGAARYLGYVRSWSNFREQIDEVMERRRKREFFRAYGRVLDFEVERCESLESFSKQLEHGVRRMGLGLSAQSGSVPETLKLVCGRLCTIHHPQDGMEASEWHLRLDVLLPALERCVEKWGALPSSIEQQVPNPTPAPSISLQA
jgi:UDP-GlcNAc:undecaprenyl-phosphate GlcNAc-1-phosphate transferase